MKDESENKTRGLPQTKAEVFVGPDGLLRFVYSDELQDVLRLGAYSLTRASHVDPVCLGDNSPFWFADMSPSGHGFLGPFETRDEALAAERRWLNARCCL